MTIRECPDYDCPETQFKHKCSKHRDNCPNYVVVEGKPPQGEDSIKFFDCALRWAPTLAVELSQRMNQMGADMETFRNELVKAQNTHNEIMAHGVNVALAREREYLSPEFLAREGRDPKLVNGDGSGS